MASISAIPRVPPPPSPPQPPLPTVGDVVRALLTHAHRVVRSLHHAYLARADALLARAPLRPAQRRHARLFVGSAAVPLAAYVAWCATCLAVSLGAAVCAVVGVQLAAMAGGGAVLVCTLLGLAAGHTGFYVWSHGALVQSARLCVESVVDSFTASYGTPRLLPRPMVDASDAYPSPLAEPAADSVPIVHHPSLVLDAEPTATTAHPARKPHDLTNRWRKSLAEMDAEIENDLQSYLGTAPPAAEEVPSAE